MGQNFVNFLDPIWVFTSKIAKKFRPLRDCRASRVIVSFPFLHKLQIYLSSSKIRST